MADTITRPTSFDASAQDNLDNFSYVFTTLLDKFKNAPTTLEIQDVLNSAVNDSSLTESQKTQTLAQFFAQIDEADKRNALNGALQVMRFPQELRSLVADADLKEAQAGQVVPMQKFNVLLRVIEHIASAIMGVSQNGAVDESVWTEFWGSINDAKTLAGVTDENSSTSII